MKSNSTRDRGAVIAWAALLIAAIIAVAAHVSRSDAWVRSNVFELLPAADYDPVVEIATRTVDAKLGTRLIFLIGHPDRDVAKRAAESLGRALAGNTLIANVTSRIDVSRYAALGEFYYRHRSGILTSEQIAAIENRPQSIEQAALAELYSPFGAGAAMLETDPFLLFPESLASLQPEGSALSLDDGFLWVSRGGIDYVLVTANLVSPTLSITQQESLAAGVNGVLEDLRQADPGLDVLRTGFPFYAREATRSAKGEVSTIGAGSLIGLVLLVVATFRSLRPLTLIVMSVLAGCAMALAVTLTVFGYVHLFTLVFGASLIGVSVDYAFHYIADDAFGDDDWTPQKGLGNIIAGITLGLATSILAYLALTVAPFPGLQQLAVFSSAGLLGAYLTLIAITRLTRHRHSLRERSIVLRFGRWFVELWSRWPARRRLTVAAAIGLIIITGARTLDIDDDVRNLQSQPPDLVAQEAAIQDMLGVARAGTFVLVTGESEQAVLEQEESIRARLEAMIADGSLDSYQAVSRWVPSRERQRRSREAYGAMLRTHLPSYLADIGVDADVAVGIERRLLGEMPALELSDWLSHPASEEFRSLWLDTGTHGAASIILLFGIDDPAILDDLVVINKGRELSTLFGEYRSRVIVLLAAAYVVILAGLAARYGVRRAGAVVAPPILAGLLALVLISIAGGTLNLFNFLALILVLGIGIDFTLFIVESKHDIVATMFAITLSALTTMLSFGLLALSSTFAVHSFGLTVLIGIALAYLLCPFAVTARRTSA